MNDGFIAFISIGINLSVRFHVDSCGQRWIIRTHHQAVIARNEAIAELRRLDMITACVVSYLHKPGRHCEVRSNR